MRAHKFTGGVFYIFTKNSHGAIVAELSLAMVITSEQASRLHNIATLAGAYTYW